MRYLVEMCTFHGPTRQRRWHRVHQGISRVECQRWVEESGKDGYNALLYHN